MATKNIQLPELGEGVTEGELVRWLVKPGDKVKPDQAIAEMMTDKATVEVPSPTGGVVTEVKFKEGEVVVVGAVMIVLDVDGATATAAKPAAATAPVQTPAPAAKNSIVTPSAMPAEMMAAPAKTASSSAMTGGRGTTAGMDVYPPAADSRVLATPATRRLAREMGIDINGMSGSGLAGRVTREDVLQNHSHDAGGNGATGGAGKMGALQIPKPSYSGVGGAAEERVPLRGIRKKIAENMQMAKHVIPHFTLMDEADVTALVKVREDLKAQGVKVTYLPFVMKALIATIRDFPMFNASIDDAAAEIVYKKYFNLGFAADTPNGLLVPVIKDADHKTMSQLSAEISDLAGRARDGKLKSEEMKGATITVTNIGSVGGTYATPIINHPEVAILGMYKISEKPVIRDGKLEALKVMNFTITADHRLIDGAVAANFLKAFIGRIQNPGALLMDMR